MRRGNVKKFGRTKDIRNALFRSLIVALVENNKIKTTLPKAKTLAVKANKAVTLAKKETLAAKRQAVALYGSKAAQRLFGEIAPKFKDRHGGYTRIVPLGQRKSDGAPMAIIEFTE